MVQLLVMGDADSGSRSHREALAALGMKDFPCRVSPQCEPVASSRIELHENQLSISAVGVLVDVFKSIDTPEAWRQVQAFQCDHIVSDLALSWSARMARGHVILLSGGMVRAVWSVGRSKTTRSSFFNRWFSAKLCGETVSVFSVSVRAENFVARLNFLAVPADTEIERTIDPQFLPLSMRIQNMATTIEDKATWNEVILPASLKQLDEAYRKANAVAKAAQEALAKELRSRLEQRHKDDLDTMEIAISFRFGKISYALVPKTAKKASKNAVKLD